MPLNRPETSSRMIARANFAIVNSPSCSVPHEWSLLLNVKAEIITKPFFVEMAATSFRTASSDPVLFAIESP